MSAIVLSTSIEILPTGAIFSKVTLERLLIPLALALLVAGGARLRHFRTGLDIPIALLLAAAAATTIRNGYPAAPLRFLVTAVALYYLTVVLCRRDADAPRALAFVALVTIVASAATGVAQVAGGEYTGFYRDGLEPVVSQTPREDLLPRAIGSFANPNLLATHVLLLAPLGLVAARAASPRTVRTALLGLVGLAYLGLILTFSRAGLGSALVAGGAAAFALRRPWRPRVAALAALVAAVVLVGVIVTGGDLVGGFGRPEAWRLASEVIRDRPVLGVGLARAGDVMNALGEEGTFRHAHNLWLTWWAEAGPLALLASLWITGWLLVRGFRDASAGSPLAAAALAGAVGFFAFSVVDHPANQELIARAFWFVAGLVAAGLPEEAGAAEEPSAGLPEEGAPEEPPAAEPAAEPSWPASQTVR